MLTNKILQSKERHQRQEYLNMYIKLNELKQRCINEKIPLVRDKTAELITNIINQNQFKTYLEIGTAYGYSAFYVALNTKLDKIETIEKDQSRFNIAKSYLNNFSHITQHLNDCLVWETNHKYDFIFVDGPKSQQINIVNKYLNYLNENGIMFIDNIELKDIRTIKNKTKNQIKIIEKVDEFKLFLKNNNNFTTEFLDIDDGVAIVKK